MDLSVARLQYMFLSPDGRIDRQTWWVGVLIIITAATILNLLFGYDSLTAIICRFLMACSCILLHAKRFHDHGRSGYWVILGFIPVIGIIGLFIYLGFMEGSSEENDYGPPLHTD